MLLQKCPVGRLFVRNTLNDVILNRLLSQLDVVDVLAMELCKMTCEQQTVTTLPAIQQFVSRIYILYTPCID